MTILDAIIILVLLAGAVLGFKKGAIRSLVALVGTIALVVISYYLKDYVAEILFNFVPFFNFKGAWAGLSTLNILLYESVAYVLVFVVLSSILSFLLKLSGIIEKILNATIILGIPSKIIGAILGFAEAIFFSFICLFVLNGLNSTHNFVKDSSFASSILNKTPLVGSMIENTKKALEEIDDLNTKYKNSPNKDAYNCEILEIMLHYEIITPDAVDKLISSKKLDFAGIEDVLTKYRKEEKND